VKLNMGYVDQGNVIVFFGGQILVTGFVQRCRSQGSYQILVVVCVVVIRLLLGNQISIHV